jgi:uncharacterized delta-60 repeat protein
MKEFAMQKRFLVSSVGVLVMTAGLVMACGDDDDNAANTPDSGMPDSGGNTGDGSTTDSGSGDATPDGTVPSTPLVPKTSLELPNTVDPYGLVWATDGKLYASGATVTDAGRRLAVWRFDNGALDTTFGTGGVLTVDVPGTDELSFDLVEVSDGNFVVEATSGGKVYLVKLTRDNGGAYSFGTPVFVKFGYDDGEGWPVGTPSPPAAPPAYASWSIAVDRSVANTPKIVVFGFGAPAKDATPANQRVVDDRWITRVLFSDLAETDEDFNGGVPFSADADGKNLRDQARRGIVLADGSILSSGYTAFNNLNAVVMIKLKPDGTPDNTFGFGVDNATTSPGQTKFNPYVGQGGFAEAYNVVRQSSGLLVTTGYGDSDFAAPTVGVDLVSFRLKADGQDPSFGTAGAFVIQSETNPNAGKDDAGFTPFDDRGRDMAILPDDRLVFAGNYDIKATLYLATKDGKLEANTGDGGGITYPWRQAFFKVAVSPDGKKVAATAKSVRPDNDASTPLASFLVTASVGQ